MRRLFVLTAPMLAALAVLAAPALAQASTGTVLSVSQPKHQVQLVTADKVVHAYRFGGHLQGVQQGTRLAFKAKGSHLTRARAFGKAKTFSFLGKVVQSGQTGVVLSLADSQLMHLATGTSSSHAGLHANCHTSSTPTVTINFNLASGQTVMVTETTDSSGNVTMTITIPPGNESQFGPEQTATGTVTSAGTAEFEIATADHSTLRFHMDPAALAAVGMSTGDAVVVSYHTDDQLLVADNVVDSGPSASSSGSGGGSSAGGGALEGSATGTITAVSASSITIATGATTTQTFSAQSASVTHGFIVGDAVNVTYEQDGSKFVADSVAYDNTLTSGVVTALAQAGTGYDTVTMTDDTSAQSEMFYLPTALLSGQGALVGDDISVAYYQATRGLTIDHLQDNTN
jgi:membrane-bound inhibitor of C-type lysozyme